MPSTSHTEVVAGSADDFMVVHHVTATGTNREIGRVLAETARASGAPLPPAADPRRNRVRRRWFERNWPQHYARMQGISDSYGLDVDDDRLDFSRLEPELMPDGASMHCSAMWVAPGSSDGPARVGRNLDFSSGTVSEFLGAPPQAGEQPVGSRPYVIETYPDDGNAAVVVTLGDFSGCVEGCNEHGLVVALLADDATTSATTPIVRPTLTPQAGLNEIHLLRYLLDVCANADEARDALYDAKQYDEYTVAHYLIADAHDAFVWERDAHNAEHVVDAESVGLCVTNHPVRRGARPSDVPADGEGTPQANSSYARARTLNTLLRREPVSSTALWDVLEVVNARGGNDVVEEQPPLRTLWHSQYEPDERRVEFEFYLGDEPDGAPKRSPRRCFTLNRDSVS